jgi:hypothetical protein
MPSKRVGVTVRRTVVSVSDAASAAIDTNCAACVWSAPGSACASSWLASISNDTGASRKKRENGSPSSWSTDSARTTQTPAALANTMRPSSTT